MSEKIFVTMRTFGPSALALALMLCALPYRTGAAPAPSKENAKPLLWKSVPPMPRYNPQSFRAGQLPAYLKKQKSTAPTPQYTPLAPAQPGALKPGKSGPLPPEAQALKQKLKRYFGPTGRSRRMLITTDRPLYQPNQWIWAQATIVRFKKPGKRPGNHPAAGSIVTWKLKNSRGVTINKQTKMLMFGSTGAAFYLPRNIAGGSYSLEVQEQSQGTKGVLQFDVDTYQAPRVKKKLEFVQKGYGPGDLVTATLRLNSATGTPLANQPIKLRAQLAGKSIKGWRGQTNAKGKAVIRFHLPATLATDDGMLTVLIPYKGMTESISRPIPLAVRQLKVGFFPEGGALAAGLPNRVYVAVKRKLDSKPVDIVAEVRDQSGKPVASLRSFHDGMGRFVFTPKANQRYTMHLQKPQGIFETFPLPQASSSQPLALQVLDDFRSKHPKLRLKIASRRPQSITITALQYDSLIAQKAFVLQEGEQYVELPLKWQARGVIKVTVWDDQQRPVAERLIFRHKERGLKIDIRTDKKKYVPLSNVTLTVQITDQQGRAVPNALFSLAVVDDSVLSYADSHEPTFLAQRFLTQQLTGKIHRPNFYFKKDKPKSWRALDLIMGTHGWRGFSWQRVKAGEKPPASIDISTWRKANQAIIKKATKEAKDAFIYKRKTSYPYPKLLSLSAYRMRVHTKQVRPKQKPQKGPKRAEKKNKADKERKPPPAPPKPAPPKPEPGPIPLVGQRGKKGKIDADDDGLAKDQPARPVIVLGKKEVQGRFVRPDAAKMFAKPQARPRVMRRAKRWQGGAAVMSAKPIGRTSDISEMLGGRGDSTRMESAKDVLGRARRVHIAKLRRQRRYRYARLRRWKYVMKRRLAQMMPARAYVRSFPTKFYDKRYRNRPSYRRYYLRDKRETVYWDHALRTNAKGIVKVKFGLSNRVTSFKATACAMGRGQLGVSSQLIASAPPFYATAKIPMAVSADDAMVVPLTVTNESDSALTLTATNQVGGGLKLMENPVPSKVILAPFAAKTFFYPIRVTARQGTGRLRFWIRTQRGRQQELTQAIRIEPRGFPRDLSIAGEINKEKRFSVMMPRDIKKTNPNGSLSLYPDPSSMLLKGIEGMLRRPGGCFEQVSSSNYPNVMLLQYLKRNRHLSPALAKKAYGYLAYGYKKLAGYETKTGGFEWFGRSPGHEALTAYGLMQFAEMKQVYNGVDPAMVKRATAWLLGRRDGKGGYKRSSRALDRFGRAGQPITNAYITWALAESGSKEIDLELKAQEQAAMRSSDPYLIALITNASLKRRGKKHPKAQELLKKLIKLQESNGSFKGQKESITYSRGIYLHTETTALALRAMIRGGASQSLCSQAQLWLLKRRRRWGGFGSTQATILTLRALLDYMNAFSRSQYEGLFELFLNKKLVSSLKLTKQSRGTPKLTSFVSKLKPGKNTFKLVLSKAGKIPFSLGIRNYTYLPFNAPNTGLSMKVKLQRTRARMGQTVRLTAALSNTTQKGQPMTVARIKYPGALQVQRWQLKQMKERKQIDFYELRPREVTIYFTSLAPGATHTLHFDLVARVTGNYNSAASCAYLYYTENKKIWTNPLRISVRP